MFFYCKFPYVRMFDFEGHVVFESCVGEAIIHPSAYLEKKENYYISCAYTDALIVAKYRPAEGDSDTSYFQVWDWEGHLLSLFEIKDRINLFTLSPDGKTLYAVKSDNDHLFWCNLPRMGQKN